MVQLLTVREEPRWHGARPFAICDNDDGPSWRRVPEAGDGMSR